METPLTLFIAMSLDGYIAGPDHNIDFLSKVEMPGEDYGYSAFSSTVDTVIMGRKTYDKVMSFGIDFPYRDKMCYVFSSTNSGSDENVEFFNGPPEKLVGMLKSGNRKGIYCDGGANLVQQMIKLDLMDHYIISVLPVILGSGIRLFEEAGTTIQLHLNYAKSFPSGLVQLSYKR